MLPTEFFFIHTSTQKESKIPRGAQIKVYGDVLLYESIIFSQEISKKTDILYKDFA